MRLSFQKKVHGCLCGGLWACFGDACRVTLEDLSGQGRTKTVIVGALICFGHIGI